MAYSANQTRLYYKTGTNSFTEIPYLMEVPEIGGDPEKIDVTVLTDTVKKYLPGIKELGDLVFKFLYDNSSATSNFRVLKALDESGKSAEFKLEYPDRTAHTFTAIPAVKINAGELNGALTFSVTMVLQSDITVTNPAVTKPTGN